MTIHSFIKELFLVPSGIRTLALSLDQLWLPPLVRYQVTVNSIFQYVDVNILETDMHLINLKKVPLRKLTAILNLRLEKIKVRL